MIGVRPSKPWRPSQQKQRAASPPQKRKSLPPGVAPQCIWVKAEPRISDASLSDCARKLQSWNSTPGPIVATFATSIREPWLLGLSAARGGMPIVVAGHGRSFRSHFNWWLGYGKKLPGSGRKAHPLHQYGSPCLRASAGLHSMLQIPFPVVAGAAQVMRALAPGRTVMWVDATDTVVVNPMVGSAARALIDVVNVAQCSVG